MNHRIRVVSLCQLLLQGKELSKRVLHCRNAPSPGATASLAIARMMADKVSTQFGLPKREKAVLY